MTRLKYRAEIDGLRALAVFPVILFHAGFEIFRGGFLGVDVFFVISGYLITTILIEDMEHTRFDLVYFYERRARRILPALFVVMLACIPFAWMWMLPTQMKDFSQSLVAVSLFASNILFWSESGYFAADAEEKPLLHTWSLAVEEQYYVFFPIFLALAWRFGKSKVFWMIVVFAGISLLLSEWGWRNHPIANFYLGPSRAWELLAGSISAFIVQKNGVQKKGGLALVGLAAIVFSIFAYDESTPFPSTYTLVPVLGVVLLILYADKETLVAKLLSTKVMVVTGLISYSAYLWHQPLFAFARIRLADQPPTVLMLILSVISLILAYLSWRYIEKPFRQRELIPRKTIFSIAFFGLLTFLVLGFVGHIQNGFRDRFDIAESIYSSLSRSERQSECFGRKLIKSRESWFCSIGDNSARNSYFVFGDSHALSFLPAIDTALTKLGDSGLFVGTGGCTPFLGIHSLRGNQVENNCNELNRRVYDLIESEGITKLILVARWTLYTDGGYGGTNFAHIGFNPHDPKTPEISRSAFVHGFMQTVKEYQKIGVEVIVVPQIPQQRYDALDIYVKSTISNKGLEELSITRDEHTQLQSFTNAVFKTGNVKVYDFTSALCNEAYCPVGTSEESYYYDDDHLSLSGSRLLVDPLIHMLSEDN